jgi:beta-alanine degradation protein BauB
MAGLTVLRPWGVVLALGATACAARPPGVSDAPPDPLAAGWKGASVCEVLLDNADLRVLRCTFPPGVGHDLHQHAPHFGYALSGGQARIEDEGSVREATTPTGYSWWTPGVTRHANQNIGETTSAYLIVEPKSARARNEAKGR